MSRSSRSGRTARAPLQHREIDVDGAIIHLVEGGQTGSAVLFLHGWPESWAIFEPVMVPLSREVRVVAMDLPGIGGSTTEPPAKDKRTLARYVRKVVHALELRDTIMVGHDVGGMIVYAYLKAWPDELRRAVIMNVAVPGVEPWSQVTGNPRIWHFAFHAVPDLPEALVTGRQAAYFDWFFDTIAGSRDAVSPDARRRAAEAYARPEALHTGFEWYRALKQDEQDNRRDRGRVVSTPVLVVRGEREPGAALEQYVEGLQDSGLRDVRGVSVPESGHFCPKEQPAKVVEAIREFLV